MKISTKKTSKEAINFSGGPDGLEYGRVMDRIASDFERNTGGWKKSSSNCGYIYDVLTAPSGEKFTIYGTGYNGGFEGKEVNVYTYSPKHYSGVPPTEKFIVKLPTESFQSGTIAEGVVNWLIKNGYVDSPKKAKGADESSAVGAEGEKKLRMGERDQAELLTALDTLEYYIEDKVHPDDQKILGLDILLNEIYKVWKIAKKVVDKTSDVYRSFGLETVDD